MASRKLVISINAAWNIYNFRSGLIRALVEAGYEVVAAAPFDDYAPRLAALGCRYVALPMDNKGTSPLRDLILLWCFWRLLQREQPAALLGYTIKPNVYGSIAAHALGIPVINNIAGLGTVFIRGGWLAWVVKLLYRLALSRSRRVFFQNDEDRTIFLRQRLVRSEQTGLLPGSGVDLQHFASVPLRAADSVGSTEAGHKVKAGPLLVLPPAEHEDQGIAPFCFLLVARLFWDKGVGEFVEAARRVRKLAPNARFQLLGFLEVQNPAAIDRATVDEWVSEGVVEYLGATDDVRPFLAAADCVVLPSYYMEGTPRSLLEAAAMARPIITTDWVGCRNVVDDGVNGMLCRVRDAGDLADRMLAMAGLPQAQRAAMGAAGRAKVEREFDERIVIGKYLLELNRVTATMS